MNQPQFLIRRVAVTGATRLKLDFADGQALDVDLAGTIARHPVLAPLADSSVFTRVALDEWRRGVIFADDDRLALASDNLRALGVEQAGGFSHQQLLVWMAHHGLTLDAAAEALDVSRRMLAYYRSGARPIPRTVGLAMLGWEVVHGRAADPAFEYGEAA